MKGKKEGSNKLLFSIKQVSFGGAFTYSHTKSKAVFSKSYKKAPGHHPTKEEVPNSEGTMLLEHTDAYRGQSIEKTGDL